MLNGDMFFEAFSHWLGAWLQEHPWLGTLRRMKHTQLREIYVRLGLGKYSTMNRRLLVRNLLTSVSNNRALEKKLLKELGMSTSRGRLARRLKDVLASMGYVSVNSMIEKYIPEAVSTSIVGFHGTVERLIEVVSDFIPSEVVGDLADRNSADLIGAVCHWLGVRLKQMPWVEKLRRVPRQDLFAMSNTLGIERRGVTLKRAILARILAAAAMNSTLEGVISQLLGVSGGVPAISSTRRVGYIDECPGPVKSDMATRAHPWQRIGSSSEAAPSRAHELLGERLQGVFATLGQDATKALAEEYCLEPDPLDTDSGGLARRVAEVLPLTIALADASRMLKLDSASLVGELCHWLGVRLERIPWATMLRRFPDLPGLVSRLGLHAPPTVGGATPLAHVMRGASQDRLLRMRLIHELTLDRVGADARCIDECPGVVQRAVLEAGSSSGAPARTA